MGRRRHTMAVEALVSPDAARVATRGTAHSATVYTNGQKRHREAVFANLCTLLRPHGLLARPSRCNSVHEWPKTAPRGYFSQSVYTLCLRGQADPAGSAWTPTRTTDSCVQGRTAPVWERPPR